jgi:hypothetical protein
METPAISAELTANFHLFWDNYPFPVMLVRKDRTMVALNKVATTLGCVTGTRCVDIGKKEDHRGCLANQALKEQEAKRIVAYQPIYDKVLDSYWIPLAGADDLYLHFSADITDYAAERMFPAKECAGTTDEKGSCSCSCSES